MTALLTCSSPFKVRNKSQKSILRSAISTKSNRIIKQKWLHDVHFLSSPLKIRVKNQKTYMCSFFRQKKAE